MTKQLSEKQKAMLRDGITAAKEGLQHIADMNRILDEIEQESKNKKL